MELEPLNFRGICRTGAENTEKQRDNRTGERKEAGERRKTINTNISKNPSRMDNHNISIYF